MTDIKFITAIFCMLVGCVAILGVNRIDSKSELIYGTPIRLIGAMVVITASIFITVGWLDIRAKENNDLHIEQCLHAMGLSPEMSSKLIVTDRCYVRFTYDLYLSRDNDGVIYTKEEILNRSR